MMSGFSTFDIKTYLAYVFIVSIIVCNQYLLNNVFNQEIFLFLIVSALYRVLTVSSYFFYLNALLLLHLIFFIPYFIFEISIATRFSSIASFTENIYAFLIFSASVIVFATDKSVNCHKVDKFKIKSDFLSLFFSILVLISALVTLRNGTLFLHDYRDLTEVRLGILEFTTIPILFSIIVSKSKITKKVAYFSWILYMFSTLITGLRLRFVSSFLIVLYLSTKEGVTFKLKLSLSTIVLILLFIGAIRNGSLGNNFIEIMINSFSNDGAIISTFGGAFTTGSFFIEYVNSINASITDRVLYFFGDLFRALFSSEFIPESMLLKDMTSQNYDIPGGGTIYSFFYIYFSDFIIIFFPFMFFLISSLISKNPSLSLIFSSVFVAYTARFMLYGWFELFRMLLAVLIVYGILVILKNKQV